ncbi:MAG: hypothetical protein AVDCRST_MAG53-283, partial [uncultured Solirubrobacteraceae bacterium]
VSPCGRSEPHRPCQASRDDVADPDRICESSGGG